MSRAVLVCPHLLVGERIVAAERAGTVREARGVAAEAAHHRSGRRVREEAQPQAAARRPWLRLRPLLHTMQIPADEHECGSAGTRSGRGAMLST